MKYIKKYELYSQFYSESEVKEFQKLAKKLKYHLSKYFDDNLLSAFCDNKETPIYLSLCTWNAGNFAWEYLPQKDIDKYIVFNNAMIDITNKNMHNSLSYILTKEEAEQLFIYFKSKKIYQDLEIYIIKKDSDKYNL